SAFAAISLVALVIVLAQKPGPRQAEREITKIQYLMTKDQVRAAIDTEKSIWARGPAGLSAAGVFFKDQAGISVTFDAGSQVIEFHEIIRNSRPWYERLRYRLRAAGLPL